MKLFATRIGSSLLFVVFALALSLTLSACDKSKEKSAESEAPAAGAASKFQIFKASDPTALKLAFVTNNASEFWKIAAAGVHKYEKEGNVQVDIKMPPNGKTEEQNSVLENLVSQGYNGIAISVIAPNDQVQNVNRAARTTNVITFDSDSPASNRILYIGTNNYEAGKALARRS